MQGIFSRLKSYCFWLQRLFYTENNLNTVSFTGQMVDLKLPKKRHMLQPASVWKRVLAFLIDFMIMQIVIVGPFSDALTSTIPMNYDFMQNYEYLSAHMNVAEKLSTVLFIVFILAFIYSVLFELSLDQTPGRMLLNLYLMPENKQDKVNLLKIIIRNLVYLPFFPFYLLMIIDPLFLVFTGKRISDKFSRTVIVEDVTI
jgi:uncharacterized RDD family membrane protein YckC